MNEPLLSHQVLISMLMHVLLIFLVAGLVVPTLQKLRISPILAYLFCGILLGPQGLSSYANHFPWLGFLGFKDTQNVKILGEFGIITLMFMIGLELSFDRLRELKNFIFGFGLMQILITSALVYVVAVQFGNSVEASVLIGAAFALSSTAIVMQMLQDQKLQARLQGQLSFSVLLMQDLAVVPILVLVAYLQGTVQENVWVALASSLGIGAAAVVVIFIVGRWLLRPLMNMVSQTRSPEWLMAFSILFVLICALLTDYTGLSLAMGAFIAGLLLAETEFKHEVSVIFGPLKGILLGVFFLSIGMLIDVNAFYQNWPLILISVVGLAILKALVVMGLGLACQLRRKASFEAALFLAQPGEFALLIFGVALQASLISAENVQFFLLVSVSGMALAPALFKAAPWLSARLFEKHNNPEEDFIDLPKNQPIIVIAGLGRVGQILADILEEQGVAYLAFDFNAQRVHALREQGYKVVYGDAKKIELWHKIHNENVVAAVVGIDDFGATQSIFKCLRQRWPMLPIILRAKDNPHSQELYDLGARYVVSEALEAGLSIARLVLGDLYKNDAQVEGIVGAVRSKAKL